MSSYTIEDLTVTICTVNRPEFLGACIASLKRTTPAGAPLQIVFNGTPSESRDLAIAQAEGWEGPLRFEHIPTTIALDESHNRALELVNTPLVNFMGDDDIVLGSRLDKILEAFNELTPEPAVVTTYARRVAGAANNPAIGSLKRLGPTTIDEWRDWSMQGRVFEMLWPGAVLHTQRLRASGGFEARFSQSVDNRIFSKLSREFPVISLTDQNFGVRIHQGSVSTSNWRTQNEHVRFVESCHQAMCDGRHEPEFEEFVAGEAADPVWTRTRRNLRDRSRMHFRRGGALALGGQRTRGALNLATACVLWPPAFVEKVGDQIHHSIQ